MIVRSYVCLVSARTLIPVFGFIILCTRMIVRSYVCLITTITLMPVMSFVGRPFVTVSMLVLKRSCVNSRSNLCIGQFVKSYLFIIVVCTRRIVLEEILTGCSIKAKTSSSRTSNYKVVVIVKLNSMVKLTSNRCAYIKAIVISAQTYIVSRRRLNNISCSVGFNYKVYSTSYRIIGYCAIYNGNRLVIICYTKFGKTTVKCHATSLINNKVSTLEATIFRRFSNLYILFTNLAYKCFIFVYCIECSIICKHNLVTGIVQGRSIFACFADRLGCPSCESICILVIIAGCIYTGRNYNFEYTCLGKLGNNLSVCANKLYITSNRINIVFFLGFTACTLI